MKNLIKLCLILCVLPLTKAYAYFDPGTGSLIIQAIVALIAGSILFLKRLWLDFYLKLTSFILRFRKKNSGNANKKIDK